MRKYVQARKTSGNPIRRRPDRNKGQRYHLRKGEREAIYERDGWVCQICLTAVDPNLPTNDRMAATLDHIEPQSLALVPNHSIDNLRLAHRVCNAKRGNRAA